MTCTSTDSNSNLTWKKTKLKMWKKLIKTKLTVKKLPKDHNSGKNQLSTTSIKYNHLQVMETITGKFHQYPLRNIGGVAETRTSVDKWLKLIKGHNTGKKQSSVTSV